MATPTFSLDLTTGVLDPRITFARTGATATRVNSSGLIESVAADTPRFDYNPITLACRGLLVEDLRANLALYSDDFANAYWTKTTATISSNAINAPDGTLTGDKMVGNAGSTGSSVSRAFTVTASTTYTVSVFAKTDGVANWVQIVNTGTTGTSPTRTWFDVSTGVVGTKNNANASALIEPFANGWYRLTVTYTTTSTSSQFIIANSDGDNINAYAGNGVSGANIWGSQVEVGSSATSYVPTTTTSLTRNPDIATITGANFSDWWQASKGGVLVRARPGTVSGVRPWLQFDDGTANEIIALRGNSTNPELYIVDGGVAQAQIDAGTIAANTDYSLTGWWATNDCKARLDSGAVVTDTSATIPTVTQARLGSDGTNYMNGHLASISYYDSFSEQIYTRRKNKAVFNLM